MARPFNKKLEVASLRRELQGERQINLTRLAGDTGTDEGEKRLQLIWQNFRISDCTKANAAVLGTDHPGYVEGKEAAAGNSIDLFESLLIPAGVSGVALEKLSSVHSHYFGGGFEKLVGTKLRKFVTERYDYDETTGRVKASANILNRNRKREARELIDEELKFKKQMKYDMIKKADGAGPKPQPVGLPPSQDAFDPDYRPRYASTKMTPDECEERGTFGAPGAGGPMAGSGLGSMPGAPPGGTGVTGLSGVIGGTGVTGVVGGGGGAGFSGVTGVVGKGSGKGPVFGF